LKHWEIGFGRLADARADLAAEQRRVDEERRSHPAQLEKAAERTRLAEHRFADMEKRALGEIDHVRTTAAKLQKSLDSERTAHAAAAERLRADYNEAQSSIARLREQVGVFQNAVATLTGERDRALEQLQATRAELAAAIRQAAAEGARAEHLRDKLARQHAAPAVDPAGGLPRNEERRERGKKCTGKTALGGGEG
jgi:chromosome segregation ATPase